MSTVWISEPISRDIPRDIIIHILSFLPVRSVLRFKSVSKSWYAFLTTRNFTSKHFTNTSAATCFLFTPRHRSSSSTTTNSIAVVSPNYTKTFTIPVNLDIPFLAISKPLRVSGSCDGLICLAILPLGSIILLWNPCNRQLKQLPISTVKRPAAGPIKVVLGFGFDKSSKDYKVLRIVYYAYPLNQVEMYSLGSNSWKEVKVPSLRFLIFESSCSVVVNGNFHWSAISFRDANGKKVIVSFDLRAETFQYVMTPDLRSTQNDDEEDSGYDDVGDAKWNLVNFTGLLGLIVWQFDRRASNKRFDLWVMSKYGVKESWTKWKSIETHEKISKTLACGTNGEILLEKSNGQLVLYDLTTKMMKNVEGTCGVASWSDVFLHADSLLSIKGGKRVDRTDLNNVVPDLFFVRKFDLALELG